MATEVDQILVKIEADMSQLNKELKRLDRQMKKSSDETKKQTDKMAKGFKTLAGAIGTYIGVQAVGTLLGFVSHVGEAMSKAEVVFGDSFGYITKEMEKFGDSVGRSTYELVEMASKVQDTFVPMGFARDSAAELSAQLTKLAVDVASFNNETDAAVMEAFQSDIVGNHETVRRFGIVITDATLQQELYRMGIEKSTQQASNAEKVQARLNMIMAGTTDAHGDAIRTSDSFANAQKKLGAALDELGVTVIEPFMDTFADFVTLLATGIDTVKELFEVFGDPKTIEGVAEALDELYAKRQNLLNQKAQGDDGLTEFGSIDDQLAELQIDIEKFEKLKKKLESGPPVVKTPSGLGENQAFDKQMISLKQSLAAINGELSGLDKEFVKFAQSAGLSLEGVTQDAEGFHIAFKNFSDVERGRLQELIELYKQYKMASSDLELYKQAEDMLRVSSAAGEIRRDMAILVKYAQEYPEHADLVNAKLDEMRLQLKMLDPAFEGVLSAAQSASEGITDAFADMVESGKFSLDSMKDIASQFIRQLIKMQIQLSIMNPMMNKMFGLTGDKALATGGLDFDKIFNFGKATGGSVGNGVPTLVGERGPEIFVPNSAGSIMNSNNTRSALSGGAGQTTVNNINVTTGVQNTVRAEIVNLIPQISRAVQSDIENTSFRGA